MVEISRVEVHYILNAIPYQAVKLVFIVVKIFLKRNKIFISYSPKRGLSIGLSLLESSIIRMAMVLNINSNVFGFLGIFSPWVQNFRPPSATLNQYNP